MPARSILTPIILHYIVKMEINKYVVWGLTDAFDQFLISLV